MSSLDTHINVLESKNAAVAAITRDESAAAKNTATIGYKIATNYVVVATTTTTIESRWNETF